MPLYLIVYCGEVLSATGEMTERVEEVLEPFRHTKSCLFLQDYVFHVRDMAGEDPVFGMLVLDAESALIRAIMHFRREMLQIVRAEVIAPTWTEWELHSEHGSRKKRRSE